MSEKFIKGSGSRKSSESANKPPGFYSLEEFILKEIANSTGYRIDTTQLGEAAKRVIAARPALSEERRPMTDGGYVYSPKLRKLVLRQFLDDLRPTVRGFMREKRLRKLQEYCDSLPDA